MTFVAGFRAYSVDLDTVTYKDIITAVFNKDFTVWGEVGFKYFAYALGLISKEVTFILIIFALITNALVVFRLYDFKDKISFPVAILCYYVQFYSFSLNGMRQILWMYPLSLQIRCRQ